MKQCNRIKIKINHQVFIPNEMLKCTKQQTELRLGNLFANGTAVGFMTANIGSMTGKSREIADIMHRRKIMIACLQETKWKGSKAKEIGEGSKPLLPWHMPSQEWNMNHLE